MYAVIGEDDSDAATLKELIHRLANDRSLTVKTKGYDGATQMLIKGATQLRAYIDLGFKRFVVAYDSDGKDPALRHEEVMSKVVRPCTVASDCCVLVPVQEIESWILADIESVSKVFSSWNPKPIKQPPESINSPKEYMEKLSKANNKKPIYHHATHNQIVAKHLRLEVVRARCPSFVPLARFVTGA